MGAEREKCRGKKEKKTESLRGEMAEKLGRETEERDQKC